MAAVAYKYTYTNPETKVTYSDWFLPSIGDAHKVAVQIKKMYADESTKKSVENYFADDFEFASSSEAYNTKYFLYDNSGDGLITDNRSKGCNVLPVRYI